MIKSNILRCPKCNSTAVRKREMIVKAGTHYRVGGSTGLSSRSSTQIFVSRGRNDWVEELTPMSYLLPIVLAVFMVALFRESSTSFGYWVVMLFNVMWFAAIHSDHKGFRQEWACSKCGEVWNPSISKENTEERDSSTEMRGI